MKSVFLIGYMGAGKTTLGKALAAKMNRPFYDLDWYIEERFHATIAELFARDGEEGFRLKEQQTLHEVADFENVVVSCGGGTPCFFDNMEFMRQNVLTVYLKATPDVLAKHLRMGKSVRPLIAGKSDDELMDFITESLEKRAPFYEQADVVFPVFLMDSQERVNETIDRLQKMLGLDEPI